MYSGYPQRPAQHAGPERLGQGLLEWPEVLSARSQRGRHSEMASPRPLGPQPGLGERGIPAAFASSQSQETGTPGSSPSSLIELIIFRDTQRARNQYLTSICLLSHHPFFSLFRECLVVLKKLIDACHENSSPKRLGASRSSQR